MLHRKSALLDSRTGAQVGALIVETVRALLEDPKPGCGSGPAAGSHDREDAGLSIGVCVPGIAYSKTGTVWAPNIPGWEHYPLRDELLRAFPGATVRIESDRTCYILGEARFGVARGCDNAIFMAVGTGIGVGILIDGKVLHGKSDIVGAIGWMALKPPYDSFYDQCGCFESHASGTGLAMQAKKRLRETPGYSGMLRAVPAEEITSYHVFDAWKKGDPLAGQVIDCAVEMWGMAAANLVSLFDPELLVFGGGVFGPAAVLIDRIYEEACKWAQPVSIRGAKFLASALSGEAGLQGAGAVAITPEI